MDSAPPHSLSPRGCPLQYLGLSLLCQIQRKKTALPTQHFSQFLHIFTAYGQINMCVTICAYMETQCLFRALCIHSCMHVLCVCIENTLCNTSNIKRWRWRCPCAGIGWGRVMILSRAMSCDNGCLAHPLITSMFTPPTTIILVFPLSKWPSCLRRFLLLIARGEYSLDVQQGPNSFELLLRTNSDFRGFHSWVDTDVLVSAIMGPLSFHANWSEKVELRGCQYREREKIYKLFSKIFFGRRTKRGYHKTFQLTTMIKVTGPMKLQIKWLSTLSQHLKGAKEDIQFTKLSHCQNTVVSHRSGPSRAGCMIHHSNSIETPLTTEKKTRPWGSAGPVPWEAAV